MKTADVPSFLGQTSEFDQLGPKSSKTPEMGFVITKDQKIKFTILKYGETFYEYHTALTPGVVKKIL